MFIDWKTILLRCSTPQIDLQLKAISIKISITFFFFCRNGQDDPEIHIEMQETQSSKNNSVKEQSWWTHTSQLQLITKLQ